MDVFDFRPIVRNYPRAFHALKAWIWDDSPLPYVVEVKFFTGELIVKDSVFNQFLLDFFFDAKGIRGSMIFDAGSFVPNTKVKSENGYYFHSLGIYSSRSVAFLALWQKEFEILEKSL